MGEPGIRQQAAQGEGRFHCGAAHSRFLRMFLYPFVGTYPLSDSPRDEDVLLLYPYRRPIGRPMPDAGLPTTGPRTVYFFSFPLNQFSTTGLPGFTQVAVPSS